MESAPRDTAFALGTLEKRALTWIAARLPRWVLPDHLTGLGMLAALGIAAGYLLSNEHAAWLWAVNALLVVHWFGDSLDGTLARVRKIERPRYGYYLDHLTDAIATVLIGIGLGLSPYMLFTVGLAIVIAYLVLSINTYLETSVFKVFKLGYLSIGPTEARIALFALNALIALGVGLGFTINDVGMTVFDVVGIAAAGLMAIAFVSRAVQNLRELAKDEPSARKLANAA